jgi:hypothetical protein
MYTFGCTNKYHLYGVIFCSICLQDDGDLSDDSPSNSTNQSDHIDGEHHYNIPIYRPYKYDPYRFMCRRERRNHWNDDYPYMCGFQNPWNPKVSF